MNNEYLSHTNALKSYEICPILRALGMFHGNQSVRTPALDFLEEREDAGSQAVGSVPEMQAVAVDAFSPGIPCELREVRLAWQVA